MTFIVPTPSEYAATKRAESAVAVASGGRPTMRLSCPSVLPARIATARMGAKEDSSPVTQTIFVDRAADGSLRLSTDDCTSWSPLTELDHFQRLAEHMGTLQLRIVTPDVATARRLALVIERSAGPLPRAEDAEKRASAASVIQALTRVPVSARVVPLVKALNAKFWAPEKTQADSFARWCSWFSLPGSPQSMPDLLDRVTDGEWVFRFGKAAGSAEIRLAKASRAIRFARPAAQAFAAATQIETAWAGQLALDSIGCAEATTTGDAPLVRPLDTDGQRVMCAMSTPSRIRPGSTVNLIGGTDGVIGNATLVELNFDEDLGLIGVFSSTKSTGSSRGWSWMLYQATARGVSESARVAAEPFLALSTSGSSQWFSLAPPEHAPSREVPLDVALGGAGY